MVMSIFSFVFEFVRKETDSAFLGTVTFFTVPESLNTEGPSRYVALTVALIFALGLCTSVYDHGHTRTVKRRVARGLPAKRPARSDRARQAVVDDYQSDTIYM